jgi:DNA-binding LytR/AlgR family response regulator
MDKIIKLKTFKGERKIDTKNIISVEYESDTLIINLEGEVVMASRFSMSKFYGLLPKDCFYRPHKSYIIRLERINYIKKTFISMDKGYKAWSSRINKPELLSRLNIL